MKEDQLLYAMARAMVAANSADFDKPAAQWTDTELVTEGFYADAKTCLETIRSSGFLIAEKKAPPKEDVVALADAIAKTFPIYRRISAADAATEILGHLNALKIKLTRTISLKL